MRLIRPCLALLLAATLTPATGQDRTFYDVEIILFENLDVRAAENEHWEPRVVVPTFEGAAAFERGGIREQGMVELPRGFQTLPLEQARLGDSIDRLEDSPRYRVIRHLLWRQPALEAPESVPLRFHAGEPLEVRAPEDAYTEVDLGPPADPAATDEAEAADAEADAEASDAEGDEESATVADMAADIVGGDAATAAAPPPDASGPRMHEARVYPLDGTIRLVVSRYLHVHTDLYYTTAVDWSEAAASRTPADAGGDGTPRDASVPPALLARGPEGRDILSYPFVQQRRMRSGVLHYLDHPVVGMLVLVTPRSEEDADAQAASGEG
ncbi:MAG: CsiV family protein [Halofilum sp. (in: g-proteobacteria)]|nr:CsiV family protein [Halofilum sp. (in: g-proteobacteria)]